MDKGIPILWRLWSRTLGSHLPEPVLPGPGKRALKAVSSMWSDWGGDPLELGNEEHCGQDEGVVGCNCEVHSCADLAPLLGALEEFVERFVPGGVSAAGT